VIEPSVASDILTIKINQAGLTSLIEWHAEMKYLTTFNLASFLLVSERWGY
jgi:hypothetical protein